MSKKKKALPKVKLTEQQADYLGCASTISHAIRLLDAIKCEYPGTYDIEEIILNLSELHEELANQIQVEYPNE